MFGGIVVEHREKDRIESGIYSDTAEGAAETVPQEPVKSSLEEQIYGPRETKPRRKMKRSTFIVTIAVLVALICGVAVGGFCLHDRNVKTTQYLNDVQEFYETANSSNSTLKFFGDSFCEDWKALIDGSLTNKSLKTPNDIYQFYLNALGWMLNKPKQNHNTLASLAEKLEHPYVKGRKGLDEIAETVQQVQQSVNDLYDVVITAKGSYKEYIPDYEAKRDKAKKHLSRLKNLLDQADSQKEHSASGD